MIDIEKPVSRKTQHLHKGRRIIATLTPGGLTLRLERTQQRVNVDYATLWRWMEESVVNIPPRKS